MELRSTRHFLLAALGSATLCGLARADTVVVTQTGFTFVPPDVTVQLGDTVRWEHGFGDHTVTEGTDGTIDGDEAFHSPLTVMNPVVEVVFDSALLQAFPRPGNRYDYFCEPHFLLGMTGSVTVEVEPGDAFCDCDDPAAAPCSNAGGLGEGCANSTGAGGVLSARGSSGVAADDLEFDATNLLPAQPALLFVGNMALNNGDGIPFGDGLRCAGQNVVRLGVQVPDSNGDATWGPGLGALGGWGDGDTRRFQAWYRDPAGSPCGSGFNLSNGYEVTFGP